MSSRASDKRRAKKKHERAVARAREKAGSKQSLVLTPEEHAERQANAMRRRLEETKEVIERQERLRQQVMPQLPPLPVSLEEAVEEEAVERLAPSLAPSPFGTPDPATVSAVPLTVEEAIATYKRSKAIIERLRKETTK